MSDTDPRLAQLLDGPAPKAVQDLDKSDTARLIALIEAALAAQDEAIASSLQRTVKHVPLPLRPLARKVLFG